QKAVISPPTTVVRTKVPAMIASMDVDPSTAGTPRPTRTLASAVCSLASGVLGRNNQLTSWFGCPVGGWLKRRTFMSEYSAAAPSSRDDHKPRGITRWLFSTT
ncbi:hypothetical protein P3C58_32580, partial [Mesorhizobium sp. XAP10]|uniref:hypothetical protein n=1 Tax=unclassified Mesorhizobium TaxID=325217 RepID=UPI0023DF71EA